MANFLEIYAIKITQPLCDFYLTSIKAKDLKELAFSEQLQYTNENGKLQGSQRKIDDKRLKEIGRYIDSVEMSIPNTIILAVNYNEEGVLIDDEDTRWEVEEVENELYKIKIPSKLKLAAVIDGQHRLKGFDDQYLEDKSRGNIDLPCSIFFDLPNSYQAFLFATINGTQKKVDKSLALEQFGFNVEDEPQNAWTPEKLAVYFTRRLNFKESPLKGHIKIAPKITSKLKDQVFSSEKEWMVSTATIVDGIVGLVSNNAKRDRVEMAQENLFGNRSRKQIEKFTDNSPLRKLYLQKEDEFIFQIVFSFLSAVKKTIWMSFDPKSYIFKTVGVQALFEFLKRILGKNILSDEQSFIRYLSPAMVYDFSNSSIQASGIGKKDIRNTLLLSSGIIDEEILTEADLKKIQGFKKE